MAFKESNIIGPILYNISGSANTAINTGTNTGTVTIGNTSSGAIAIECGTAGLSIGATANAHSSTLGSTNTTSSTVVQSGTGNLNVTATNGALTINAGTGTIDVSDNAANTTVNVGTGAAAKTVTLGSSTGSSSTTIDTGSGGINVPSFGAGAVVSSPAGLITSVNGTAGYLLTANSGAAPSFQPAPSGGGSFVFLTSHTVSGTEYTIDFDNTYITSTYKNYLVVFNGLSSDTTDAGNSMKIRLSEDNGSTFITTTSAVLYNAIGSTTYTYNSSTTGQRLTRGSIITAFGGYCYLFNLGYESYPATVGRLIQSSDFICTFSGVSTSTYTVNFIQFIMETGSIAYDAGTVYLYGILDS